MARRYYLHRALRTYHTEGADRVTRAGSTADLREKVRVFSVLGEDTGYLAELKRVDHAAYRRTMLRVCAARVLRPLLRHCGPAPQSGRDAWS